MADSPFWMIWPGNAALSALTWFVIAMPFLYAARAPVHGLLRSLGQLAGGPLRLFIISGVKMKQGNRGDSYTLTYFDKIGIKYEFTFHYFPDEAEGGAIRIKNRNETVWVKKKKPDDVVS